MSFRRAQNLSRWKSRGNDISNASQTVLVAIKNPDVGLAGPALIPALGKFCLGLFEDGDVRVGILPEGDAQLATPINAEATTHEYQVSHLKSVRAELLLAICGF